MKRKKFEAPEPIHLTALGSEPLAFRVLGENIFRALKDTCKDDWLQWDCPSGTPGLPGWYLPAKILLDLARIWKDEKYALEWRMNADVGILVIRSGFDPERNRYASHTQIKCNAIKELPEWREGRPTWATKEVFIPFSIGEGQAEEKSGIDPWLAKAVSKDECRPELCRPYGDFCADGYRAHIDRRYAPSLPEYGSPYFRDKLYEILDGARALPRVALVDGKKLAKAAKLASAGNKATIHLAFNGKLDCYGESEESGRFGITVYPEDGYAYDGEDYDLLVNPKFLQDALSGLTGEIVIGIPDVDHENKHADHPIYLSDGTREALVMPKLA